jgi:hypothetical protein
MTILVYDLGSTTQFVNDMQTYPIFQTLLADSVFGLSADMVSILSITPVKADRRLRFLAVALPTKESRSARPPPAPRWLQTEYEPVPQPLPLEEPGVKSDGKAGGPYNTSFEVKFRISTGDSAELPFRVLTELNAVNMGALTFQLKDVMAAGSPVYYVVSVYSIDVYPVFNEEEEEAQASDQTVVTAHSLAASQFGRRPLFSVNSPFVLIFAATAASVVRWH